MDNHASILSRLRKTKHEGIGRNAESKIEAFRAAGIEVAETPSDMADALIRRMKRA